MYKGISFFAVFILTALLSGAVMAQTDTTKVSTKNFENEINARKTIPNLKAKVSTKRVAPKSNFNLNLVDKPNAEAIQKNLNSKSRNNDPHFLLEYRPEDRDIIGKKYWMGKDVTNERLKSNYSLGTVSTKSKTVRVECRDFSLVDGDRITIYQNERPISSNVGLKRNYYVFYIELVDGYNRIDFQALNQGYTGPNTAELKLYDEQGNILSDKEWNLATGQTATLGVIRKR